jgi:hypothetical protein
MWVEIMLGPSMRDVAVTLATRQWLSQGGWLICTALAAARAKRSASRCRKVTDKKQRYICTDCGGENILVDAYACWDYDTQAWALFSESPGKYEYCQDCEEEGRQGEFKDSD